MMRKKMATMDDAFETGSTPQIHISLGAMQGYIRPAATRVSGDWSLSGRSVSGSIKS